MLDRACQALAQTLPRNRRRFRGFVLINRQRCGVAGARQGDGVMARRTTIVGLVGVALLAANCREAAGPERAGLGVPRMDVAAASNKTANKIGARNFMICAD